jgi:hypothetical protein
VNLKKLIKNIINLLTKICLGIIILLLVLYTIYYIDSHSNGTRRFNTAAHADLRNAATAQELYFKDHSFYAKSVNQLVGHPYNFSIAVGTTLLVISSNNEGYEMLAFHENGSKAYCIKGPGEGVEEMARAEALSILKGINK